MTAPLPPLPEEDLAHVLAHTQALWSEAKGASFFITGGTGFFGMWLLESFARANDEMRLGMRAMVLTRSPEAFAGKAPHLAGRDDIALHRGELTGFVPPAGEFTHVIHAAADTGVWTKNHSPEGLLERIAAGTTRVLDVAEASGAARVLHISSGAVYGPQPAELERLPDDFSGQAAPLPAGAAWAEGKRLAESLCRTRGARLRGALVIARCFAFVGPHLTLDGGYAIGNFLRDAMTGGPIRVSGDGRPRRSYLYAADLAVWLWSLLFAGRSGRAYNVGSSEEISIGELARLVAAEAGGVPVEIALPPGAEAPSRYVPSIARAEAELGLHVWTPLDVAIRKTLAWQRSAPALSP